MHLAENPYSFGSGATSLSGPVTRVSLWDAQGNKLDLDNGIDLDFPNSVPPVKLTMTPVESPGDSMGAYYLRWPYSVHYHAVILIISTPYTVECR